MLQVANVRHVFNFDLERIELRTFSRVAVGDPLLVHYGEHYIRNYQVNNDVIPSNLIIKNGVKEEC